MLDDDAARAAAALELGQREGKLDGRAIVEGGSKLEVGSKLTTQELGHWHSPASARPMNT